MWKGFWKEIQQGFAEKLVGFDLSNYIWSWFTFHGRKFALIDQTQFSPVLMICNKLVHFANVFFGVSTGGVHIDQTPGLLCSNMSKQEGDNISCLVFFCQLVGLWKCVVAEICSKMCFLGSPPLGGKRINLGWIPPLSIFNSSYLQSYFGLFRAGHNVPNLCYL